MVDRSKRKPKPPTLSPPPVKRAPPPPKILGTYGKAEWKRTVKLMMAEGIYTEMYRQTLLIACIEFDRYMNCIEYIIKNGETWKGKNGYVQIRPESTQANRSFASYTKLLSRLGQDPVSVGKIKHTPQVEEKPNAMDEI